jgi:hypothetical protein
MDVKEVLTEILSLMDKEHKPTNGVNIGKVLKKVHITQNLTLNESTMMVELYQKTDFVF